MVTPFASRIHEVEAASDNLNLKAVDIHSNVDIPVMFKEDTLAKRDDQLHSTLDQKIKNIQKEP